MSQHDLTVFEWRVIEPLLPNKPRGVPRVDDRRVLNGIFLGAPLRCAIPPPARALCPAYHLLQSFRAMAEGRRGGRAEGCHQRRPRRRDTDDRQHFHPVAPAGCDGRKGDPDHCLGRSRGGLTTKIYVVVDAQGLQIRLGLTAGQAHDG